MKKQLTILLILIFTLGLFTIKFFNPYVHAVYPDPIYDESLYPKITSVSPTSPTKIRMHRDTLEIIGENFENVMLKIGNEHHVPEGSLQGNTNKVADWSDTKILIPVNYQTGWEVSFTNNLFSTITTKFELLYEDKDGKAASVEYYFDFILGDTCQSDWDWTCTDYGACLEDGTQTRICVPSGECEELNNPMPKTEQSCAYEPPYEPPIPPSITSISPEYIYENSEITLHGERFGPCSVYDGTFGNCKVRINSLKVLGIWSFNWSDNSITFTMPYSRQSGYITVTDRNGAESDRFNFTLSICSEDTWECGDWSSCSAYGQQTRNCDKTYDCPSTNTPSPATTQSCTYAPPCTADTWQCGNWGTCSPQGIQTRSCNKTYDCPSAETASPATSQYCQTPNQPEPQTPSDDLEITNQSSIIKATVKLLCPVSATMASQGSGTVIDSDGTILTNKHVVDGTAGCLVGFIDNYNDEPYFADRHIADIYSVSSDADVAILKLRNPDSRNLTSINITGSNSNNLSLGDQITTYGYPAKFGTKITYTSGDFSGVDGNYLKTTAIIEYGNSGGGAYLKNGTFIGIPTAVMKGDLNSMGYILSVNKINSWLNGSPMAYNYNDNNKYARVSILEDIDLSTLDSLDLFISSEDASNETESGSDNVIQEEKSLITKIDKNLSKRVSGKILLQVEKNGEGWYVYPDNQKKYYLGRPTDAFSIMRNLGLGIKHSELNNYINSTFPSRLSGKIMLDVEQNGEAYYINPDDLKGYYLNRPSDAFRIMRELGLGITNDDVRKIDVGELE